MLLQECILEANKGPGLDISSLACAKLVNCTIKVSGTTLSTDLLIWKLHTHCIVVLHSLLASHANTRATNGLHEICAPQGNTGGLWAWDQASAFLDNTSIAGGESIALLAQDDSAVECEECVIDGIISATDPVWNKLSPTNNEIATTDTAGDIPPLDEPFTYTQPVY